MHIWCRINRIEKAIWHWSPTVGFITLEGSSQLVMIVYHGLSAYLLIGTWFSSKFQYFKKSLYVCLSSMGKSSMGRNQMTPCKPTLNCGFLCQMQLSVLDCEESSMENETRAHEVKDSSTIQIHSARFATFHAMLASAYLSRQSDKFVTNWLKHNIRHI